MSVEIIKRETEVPLVRHVDCDIQMEYVDTLLTSISSVAYLYQCGKCKKIESVREQ